MAVAVRSGLDSESDQTMLGRNSNYIYCTTLGDGISNLGLAHSVTVRVLYGLALIRPDRRSRSAWILDTPPYISASP